MPRPARGEKRNIFGLIVGGAIPLGAAAWLRSLEATPNVAPPPARELPDPNGYDLYVASRRSAPCRSSIRRSMPVCAT